MVSLMTKLRSAFQRKDDRKLEDEFKRLPPMTVDRHLRMEQMRRELRLETLRRQYERAIGDRL